MADDQLHETVGSFPPGATPPTVPWTEPPIFALLHAPRPADESLEGQWHGRRTLAAGPRTWICLAAVATLGYFTGLAVIADWVEHPVLAGMTVAGGAVGAGALVASAWARRPVQPSSRVWSQRRLPRTTRRALAHELRAGRPGPPELRPYTVAWVCQHLHAPWTPALAVIVLASNIGTSARSGPTPGWLLVLLVVVVTAVGVAIGLWALRHRAAHRVADALDQLTAPVAPRVRSPRDET